MRRAALLILMMGMAGCSPQAQQAAAGTASPPSATPTPPDSTSLSGTYVSVGHDSSTDQVFIEALRITQSGPNQFTGTLESTEVNQAGKTTNNTQNVTGNFDGTHATIALDQVIGHVNREATIASDSITMTWMQNGQLATEQFARKSDEQYAFMLQTLGHAAQNLVVTDAAVAKAQQANKDTAELVGRLQHFLDKETTWSVSPAAARHKKAVAYGDVGLAKVKQLLALHQFQANLSASTLTVQMNTAAIQLGLALDNDTNAVNAAQQKMASLDNAIAVSPCLAPDGSLVPNPLPACAPLPDLVSRYRAVHGSAESILAQLNSVNQQTRSEYEERLKEAQDLVDGAH
ncbi:hypothetical protein [Dyella caseinilytica]|uniref:DUF2884 family protein n=1 Tax=Dyella caseinilytica TaxID=1849581 RepID=A0ABX7GQ95_9GAMM|nr:hypothetical protein [Dyella caseinilytica]QRN52243.1 hypothetical protein ISN74_12160 [Dyella caseinilytica]